MSRKLFVSLVLVVSLVSMASAAPYYYLFSEPAPAPEQAMEAIQKAGEQVSEKAQEATSKAQDAMRNAASQASGAVQQSGGPLKDRIQNHLSDLYSHGSSAMKSVVENVQPDIRNIGRDMGEVLSQTGNRVAKTAGPYLDQANKAVSPYVSQAREEVPKLIGQAKPVINKVGEQVRSGIGGVLNKIQQNGQQQAPEPGQVVTDAMQQVQEGANNIKQQVEQKAPGS